MRRCSFFAALIWAAIVAPAAAQQAGHRVIANEVVVDRAEHWQNWLFPSTTITISPQGEVRPNRVERHTNAVFDIVEAMRLHVPDYLTKNPEEIVLADAILGGSNRAGVVHVLDGDMATYWEPDSFSGEGDLGAQWWFSVDLGRLTFAQKIVLRFVEEGQGDPFLLFDVLISDGLQPGTVQGFGAPAFTTVMRTLQENKNQRVFEMELTRQVASVRGAAERFVQVVITGSDGPLGREVSPVEYEGLGGDDRGGIQFFKRQPDGREVVVEADVYQALDPQVRGAVRYFRRERPRLAEVEVWNEGDELIGGVVSRGGGISSTATQTLALTKFIDGSLASFNGVFWGVESAVADPEKELAFDLGSFYWVDTGLLAYNGISGGRFGLFGDYRLDVSDGSQAADGSLQWVNGFNREQLGGGQYERSDFAAPIKGRFFRLQWTMDPVGARVANLAEVQLYGQGVQPEVSLESDLIRLGGSRNLLSVEWVSEAPPGTRVLIQTRTGNDLGEILRYFHKDGTEVTEEQYGRLLSLFKGDIVPVEVPGSDWSDWSEPYARPQGSPIASPSPREFLKIRATLLSDDPEAGAMLRSVRLRFANPVAQSLLGEVTPFQVDSLGVERPFSLYIRPQLGSQDPGFDQLRLMAPGNMALGLVGLYGGGEEDFSATDDIAGLALPGVIRVPTGSDTLQLAFPPIDRGDLELLRLDFTTALFATGAVLRAEMQNSVASEGAWQRLDAGDALARVVSNTTTLVGSIKSKDLLTHIEVVPPVFSPNGDGINDRAVFSFKVVRVGDDAPVEAVVYDLGGRLVRRLVERRALSTGQYQMAWDGRADSGGMVAPGLYCVRLRVATDTDGAEVGSETAMRTVAVSY